MGLDTHGTWIDRDCLVLILQWVWGKIYYEWSRLQITSRIWQNALGLYLSD